MRDNKAQPFKVSYAQNREDILLEGMLKGVENGFYVDVGANHPTLDSVTKLFYDRGWRGINIEPSPVLFETFEKLRPEDINLNLGISAKKEKKTFRFYKNGDGLSTFSKEMMAEYSKKTDSHTDTFIDSEVQVDTLASVLAKHASKTIHFLKIDVEGFEHEVLHGNDWSKFRPWVICIEATHIQHSWDTYVKDQGYEMLFFDGLNNYYVANEHHEIIDMFSYAFTIFPTPILNQQAYMYVRDLQKTNDNLLSKIAHADSERAALVGEIGRLHQEVGLRSGVKGSVKNVARSVDSATKVYIEKLNKPKIKKTQVIDLEKTNNLDEAKKLVRLHDLEAYYAVNSGERLLYKTVSATYNAATRLPVRGAKKVRRKLRARSENE